MKKILANLVVSLLFVVSAYVPNSAAVAVDSEYYSADYLPLDLFYEWYMDDGTQIMRNYVSEFMYTEGPIIYTVTDDMTGAEEFYSNDDWNGLLMYGTTVPGDFDLNNDGIIDANAAVMLFEPPLMLLPGIFDLGYAPDTTSTTYSVAFYNGDTFVGGGSGMATVDTYIDESLVDFTTSGGVVIHDLVSAGFDVTFMDASGNPILQMTSNYLLREGVGFVSIDSALYDLSTGTPILIDEKSSHLNEFITYYPDTGYIQDYFNASSTDYPDVLTSYYNEAYLELGDGVYCGRTYNESGYYSDGVQFDETYFAYAENTNYELIKYEDSLSSPLGGMMQYMYFENGIGDEILPSGVKIIFDDWSQADYIPTSEDEGKITKVEYYNEGSTAYFLWEAVGDFAAYTVLWYGYDYDIGSWVWNSYSFEEYANLQDPSLYTNPLSWTLIESNIPEPDPSVLPAELGDWLESCLINGIIPEVPALYWDSGDSDGDGYVDYVDNYNDYFGSWYELYYESSDDGDRLSVDMYFYSNEYFGYENIIQTRMFDFGEFGFPEDLYIGGGIEAMVYEGDSDSALPIVSIMNQWYDLYDYCMRDYYYESWNTAKDTYYAAGGAWQKTIEYWDDDYNNIHYQWFVDTEEADELVYEERDEFGRVIKQVLDTGNFSVIEYWESGYKKQEAYFTSDWAWQKTIEFWEYLDSIMHYEHIADYDPAVNNVDVYREYDSLGRLTWNQFDSGDFTTTEYWGGSNAKMQDAFFDAAWNWQKTIEYYEDGTTKHYEHIADYDPAVNNVAVYREYDASGILNMEVLDDGSVIMYGDMLTVTSDLLIDGKTLFDSDGTGDRIGLKSQQVMSSSVTITHEMLGQPDSQSLFTQ